MRWYTPVDIPAYPFNIAHTTRVLSIGSCFAAQMGTRMQQHQFDTVLNPFGIVYNPASVWRTMERLETGHPFTTDDLIEWDGWYHSFLHHGTFSATDPQSALGRMNEALVQGHERWKTAEVIILTLGTAYAYRHIPSCQIVTNNHKIPHQQFERELLTVPQITALLDKMICATTTRQDPPHWVLTVSPVRHLKDGATGNQRSKAHLITAVHDIIAQYPQVHYFPAYEIMMDELRDYRFYKTDHSHPTNEATDHIWSAFADAFFLPQTQTINTALAALLKDIAHKPLHPDSPAYRQFCHQRIERIDALMATYPFLQLDRWKDAFQLD